ncbi:hypothetical protein HELRODRAFT_177338 [Helobdella robusta]|uniref:C-type lectin domain-containing protein n=1 Tax=Helobdella robusta TaxID=6412 RepID=T1FBJ1_HELRO|nr:hypothetical protein HELRODRAFT_177338 [Helobdella robusta]ESN98101.1 hypothetical protein HELRODRAFT_177338 [Helobdella robusta]
MRNVKSLKILVLNIIILFFKNVSGDYSASRCYNNTDNIQLCYTYITEILDADDRQKSDFACPTGSYLLELRNDTTLVIFQKFINDFKSVFYKKLTFLLNLKLNTDSKWIAVDDSTTLTSDSSNGYGYAYLNVTGPNKFEILEDRPTNKYRFLCGNNDTPIEQPMPWYSARNFCIFRDTDLTVVSSTGRSEQFKNLPVGQYWIGHYKEYWTWESSGSKVRYSNWREDYPKLVSDSSGHTNVSAYFDTLLWNNNKYYNYYLVCANVNIALGISLPLLAIIIVVFIIVVVIIPRQRRKRHSSSSSNDISPYEVQPTSATTKSIAVSSPMTKQQNRTPSALTTMSMVSIPTYDNNFTDDPAQHIYSELNSEEVGLRPTGSQLLLLSPSLSSLTPPKPSSQKILRSSLSSSSSPSPPPRILSSPFPSLPAPPPISTPPSFPQYAIPTMDSPVSKLDPPNIRSNAPTNGAVQSVYDSDIMSHLNKR